MMELMISLEDQALIQYMADSGVPHAVTSTTGGKHAVHSYHYAQGTGGPGLAVDFAGTAPGVDSPALLHVYEALLPLKDHAAELFYSGPGGGLWRFGHLITDASIAAAHHNHVHVAVPLGMFAQWPKPQGEGNMPDYAVNAPPVSIAATPTGKGYWVLCADGGVITFGDAEYFGRVHKA